MKQFVAPDVMPTMVLLIRRSMTDLKLNASFVPDPIQVLFSTPFIGCCISQISELQIEEQLSCKSSRKAQLGPIPL